MNNLLNYEQFSNLDYIFEEFVEVYENNDIETACEYLYENYDINMDSDVVYDFVNEAEEQGQQQPGGVKGHFKKHWKKYAAGAGALALAGGAAYAHHKGYLGGNKNNNTKAGMPGGPAGSTPGAHKPTNLLPDRGQKGSQTYGGHKKSAVTSAVHQSSAEKTAQRHVNPSQGKTFGGTEMKKPVAAPSKATSAASRVANMAAGKSAGGHERRATTMPKKPAAGGRR